MKIQYVLLSILMSYLSGWIPVTRKLPHNKHKSVTLGIICFCLLQGYLPAVCQFSPGNKRWYQENGYRDVTEFVSHWKIASDVPSIFFDEWIINKRQQKREVE